MNHARFGLLAALAILIPACGGGSGGVAGGGTVGTLVLDMVGGTCTVASGTPLNSIGGWGNQMSVFSAGHIYAGIGPAPVVPPVPASPATGFEVTSLAADVVQPGTVLLGGTVTTASAAAGYSITSTGGDIVISGTLRAGDPGAGKPVNLTLSALNGTVYVTGTISAVNTDGTPSGDWGGTVNIAAARIVFTGTIDTRGESNPGGDGGFGGTVQLATDAAVGTDILLAGGSITTSGGATTAPAAMVDGGNGAPILLTAAGTLQVHGTTLTTSGGDATSSGDQPHGGFAAGVILQGISGVVFNASIVAVGGTATGTGTADGSDGGQGGDVAINVGLGMTTGPVQVFGAIHQRGGHAHSARTVANTGDAGACGSFEIGSAGAEPVSVDLGAGSWRRVGGDSPHTGGGGGNVFLENTTGPGSIVLASSIDVSSASGGAGVDGGRVEIRTLHGDIFIHAPITSRGGNAMGTSGDGGEILIRTNNSTSGSAGSIAVTAPLDASGGSSLGGNGSGGMGGRVILTAANVDGSVAVLAAITVDGGSSTGTSSGGFGGQIRITAWDERIAISGDLKARGGPAGTAATGGQSGFVWVNSDMDDNDIAGSITVSAGVTVDASGGSGGTGGLATNNGVNPPSDFTSAILFVADQDGDDVGEGSVINNGLLRADGGAATAAQPGGHGGLILLRGRGAAGPPSVPFAGTTSTLGGAGTPAGVDGTTVVN